MTTNNDEHVPYEGDPPDIKRTIKTDVDADGATTIDAKVTDDPNSKGKGKKGGGGGPIIGFQADVLEFYPQTAQSMLNQHGQPGPGGRPPRQAL